MSKSTVDTTHIALVEASIVHTKMNRDDVAEFVRDGNNLLLKLKNGEVIVIENFFVIHDGVASDLVFEENGCVLYWFDGISNYKGISGLEVLLPDAAGKLGALVPWLVGAGVIGGVIAVTGDDKETVARDNNETIKPDFTVPKAPEVIIHNGNDGSIDSADLVNGKVTATVKPVDPVQEGDVITITRPDGSTKEVVVDASNKDDINSNGISIEFDKP
ncbi:BapA/Bap/LapF family prefix-like domain-containing protein, partial [Acinetobacter silvestris]|uniref:BapA/Bap/LapF family prefix-like domain-containing protein n=1 Tax=Acinetobacter silvestris TaxID=1977882 RepID=UPI00148AD040